MFIKKILLIILLILSFHSNATILDIEFKNGNIISDEELSRFLEKNNSFKELKSLINNDQVESVMLKTGEIKPPQYLIMNRFVIGGEGGGI